MGAPVRSESGGALIWSEAPEKNFWVVPLHFLALKVHIIRFGQHFRNGGYSLVSLLFAVFLLTVPHRAQSFVKVGARAPVPHGVGATVGGPFPYKPRVTRGSVVGFLGRDNHYQGIIYPFHGRAGSPPKTFVLTPPQQRPPLSPRSQSLSVKSTDFACLPTTEHSRLMVLWRSG